jgi:hypothetical protein
MDHLRSVALQPAPVVLYSLEALIGHVESREGRAHADEPGIGSGPQREEGLGQGLVGGGGRAETETRYHPAGPTAASREKPSYHPMLLDQPMSASPASPPCPRRLASLTGMAELSSAW